MREIFEVSFESFYGLILLRMFKLSRLNYIARYIRLFSIRIQYFLERKESVLNCFGCL